MDKFEELEMISSEMRDQLKILLRSLRENIRRVEASMFIMNEHVQLMKDYLEKIESEKSILFRLNKEKEEIEEGQ